MTVAEMQRGCEFAVEMSRGQRPAMDNADWLLSGLCIGKVEGTRFILAAPEVGHEFAVCMPELVTAGEAIAVVAKYIRDHPERMHLGFEDTAIAAVKAAWPCGAGKSGCTVPEIVSVTGHSLRRAQEILDRYLKRTSKLAANAVAKFENVLETDFAKRAAK
jgi:hypothetical protein